MYVHQKQCSDYCRIIALKYHLQECKYYLEITILLHRHALIELNVRCITILQCCVCVKQKRLPRRVAYEHKVNEELQISASDHAG